MNTPGCLKKLESDSATGTFRKRAVEGVLIWSEVLCLFSVTYVGVVVMDEIVLYPSPHLRKDDVAIHLTKTRQLKWKQDIAHIPVCSRSKCFFSRIC